MELLSSVIERVTNERGTEESGLTVNTVARRFSTTLEHEVRYIGETAKVLQSLRGTTVEVCRITQLYIKRSRIRTALSYLIDSCDVLAPKVSLREITTARIRRTETNHRSRTRFEHTRASYEFTLKGPKRRGAPRVELNLVLSVDEFEYLRSFAGKGAVEKTRIRTRSESRVGKTTIPFTVEIDVIVSCGGSAMRRKASTANPKLPKYCFLEIEVAKAKHLRHVCERGLRSPILEAVRTIESGPKSARRYLSMSRISRTGWNKSTLNAARKILEAAA